MTPAKPIYSVPLEAGLWAVALVVLVALALFAVVRLLRRPPEVYVPCCTPGSMGRHPLQAPDANGVRRCECGSVALVPAASSTDVQLAVLDPARAGIPVDLHGLSLGDRTDTRELRRQRR